MQRPLLSLGTHNSLLEKAFPLEEGELGKGERVALIRIHHGNSFME
jgi:hypothetical protein